MLSNFFSCPMSSEEKKRKANQRLKCVFVFSQSLKQYTHAQYAAEQTKSDPTQYILTMDDMLENDYPIPSYMADVFQKPAGWVETPKEPENVEPKATRKIYAIDCEMVRSSNGVEVQQRELKDPCLVFDRRW